MGAAAGRAAGSAAFVRTGRPPEQCRCARGSRVASARSRMWHLYLATRNPWEAERSTWKITDRYILIYCTATSLAEILKPSS